MGTRCDFYLGRGLTAKYLGSLGQDGWARELAPRFEGVTSETTFEQRLNALFEDRGHVSAEYGWPWPWKDSEATGQVVAFDDGRVWCRHTSGFWAPISDPDMPGSTPCVFADMLEQQQGTPEGRLRLRIRRETLSLLPVDLPLLPMIAAQTVKLFLGRWFHVSKGEDGYWSPSVGEYAVRDFDRSLESLARVLQTSDDYQAMRQANKGVDPSQNVLWDVLDWLTTHTGTVPAREVYRKHALGQPYLFGCAIPESVIKEFGEKAEFHHIQAPEVFEQMLALCIEIIGHHPNIYASVVATEANRFGLATSTQASMRGFISHSYAELGNVCIQDLCGSEAGRQRVRQFMADRYYL